MTTRRRLAIGLIFGALLVPAPTARAQSAAAAITLEEALTRAAASSPIIRAAQAQRAIGEAGRSVARQLPNPEVSYEATKDTPRQVLSAMFPIELGGKRARRIDLANAALGVIDADIDVVVAEVRNDVRRAYFELAVAEQRLALAEGVRALVGRLKDAVEARFAAGDAPRLEAVQAAMALADSDNEVTAATGSVGAARAELNTLIGQPPDASLTASDPAGPRDVPVLSALLDVARRSNADLVALDRRILEQTARRDLERTLRTPDVSAGPGLLYDAKPEFTYGWRMAVNVTVPVFTQHQAEVALADASLAQVRAERDARTASVTGAIAAAHARATAAREQLIRFEAEILPRAREVEQMAQDGYAAGQTSLPVLVQALQGARDVRRRGLQAGLDFHMALADLERALGAPLR